MVSAKSGKVHKRRKEKINAAPPKITHFNAPLILSFSPVLREKVSLFMAWALAGVEHWILYVCDWNEFNWEKSLLFNPPAWFSIYIPQWTAGSFVFGKTLILGSVFLFLIINLLQGECKCKNLTQRIRKMNCEHDTTATGWNLF